LSHAQIVASASLPTRHGDFEMRVYRDGAGKEHAALLAGELDVGEPVLVRLHSECMTGDVFGSRRCDCGEQLDRSLELLQERGDGVLLYLRQEGRGIGLTHKILAYALQEKGLDTVEANHALGLPEDARDYRIAAQILLDLGIERVLLMTNNPAKIKGLEDNGVEVVERLPVLVCANPSNAGYLATKREKMGHVLRSSPLDAADGFGEADGGRRSTRGDS
jgi:GTP cyclohydrolase II